MSGKKAFIFHVRVFASGLTPFQQIPHQETPEKIFLGKIGL